MVKIKLSIVRLLNSVYDSVTGAIRVTGTLIPGGLGGYHSYEDPSFVTGETGRVLNVNADLGRNASRGYFANDGSGDIKIKIAEGDGTVLGPTITIKPDDTFPFEGMDIDNIELTWVADTAYRCVPR